MNKIPPLLLLLLFITIVGCSKDEIGAIAAQENDEEVPLFEEIIEDPVSEIEDSQKDPFKKKKKEKKDKKKKSPKFKILQGDGFIIIKIRKQEFYIDTEILDFALGDEGFNIFALDGSFEVEVKAINEKLREEDRIRINEVDKMDFQADVSKNHYLNIRVDFFHGRKICLKEVVKVLRGIKGF